MTPQKEHLISPAYAIWLRSQLLSGDQKNIAEQLDIQYVYVKQVLGGNRNKPIKSKKAKQVVQIAEEIILLRNQKSIDASQQIINKIKNRKKKTPQSYTELIFHAIRHDIYSPISSVNALFQALAENGTLIGIDDISKIANKASKNLSYSLHLIDSMIEWASVKIQLKESYYHEPSDAQQLFEECVSVLAPQQVGKSLVIESKFNFTELLYFNRDILKFSLRNILHNAIKFSPNHSVIEVSFEKDNRNLKVCVSNQGNLIQDSVAAHIFDIRNRKSIQGTAQESGSGIGLALCKEMLESNGGKVWFENKPPHSVCFHLQIPFYVV